MEIERKFLVEQLPEHLDQYQCLHIEQGYLSTDPVVRVRKEDEDYYLTYKSVGLLAREEYNMPLTPASYVHLKEKADGILISKKRYRIPYQEKYTIELDVFQGELSPLVMAEVEFGAIEEAQGFSPPSWFGEDVTYSEKYHNSNMSQHGIEGLRVGKSE